MNKEQAVLIDYVATTAFTKLGRDAIALLVGTWFLDGKSGEEMVAMLQAKVKESEDAAQAAIDKL